jgi:PAT family beta-lactamase induction signal transducer AmpG
MRKYLDVLFNRRMLVILIMGFSSGLPLALTGSTLKARISESHVDLTTIGLFSLVGLPYTLKLLWSPFFDRFTPSMGRRRGWLILTQFALLIGLAVMAFLEPSQAIIAVGATAIVIAFFSASQDVAIDAYRREILPDVELAWGNSLVVTGYRVAMLVSGGLALILADHMSWTAVYLVMAGCMLIGIVTTFLAEEPQIVGTPPKTLVQAYGEPLKDLFSREGVALILGFIFLYKLGDAMALEMTIPFYKSLQFTKTEIGSIVKIFGFWGVITGGFLGGIGVIRFGLYRALFIFGVIQIVAILGFAWLATMGHDLTALASVILLENLTVGMSTAAYVTYLAIQTNKRFSATQFALLSSITSLPRVIFGSTTGWFAEHYGFQNLFFFCAALGIPALLMIFAIRKLEIPEPANKSAPFV